MRVEANAKADQASTVNGSIHLAEGAQVGDASTVNGGVKLGERAHAKSISTVNGDVTLAKGATVSGDVSAVNGAFNLAPGSAVDGSLSNVSSRISVDGAHVGAGIATVAGDIEVTGDAVVDGGIKVRKPNGKGSINLFGGNHVPVITIGAGATVNGPLTFEREVTLYVSDDAHVAGPITGATAVKFSGNEPPAS
ncbi:MAG: hypothetical protein ACREPL_02365 [Rhodanobacteraceae bacterium]